MLWLNRVAPSPSVSVYYIHTFTFIYKIKGGYTTYKRDAEANLTGDGTKPYIPTHPTHPPRGTNRRLICSLDPATGAASLFRLGGQKIQGQPRLCAMIESLFPNNFCCCLKRNRPVAPSTQQKPLVCWVETVLLYNLCHKCDSSKPASAISPF